MLFRNNWRECGPVNLFAIGKEKVSDEWIDMANDVKEFYIGEEEMEIEKHFKNITDMLSDAMFTYGTDYTVRYGIVKIKICLNSWENYHSSNHSIYIFNSVFVTGF